MITNQKKWESTVKKNTDPYGLAVVNVARKVMKWLDEHPEALHIGYYPDLLTAHGIICEVDKSISESGGLSGFQGSCVAAIVGGCHSRGIEFINSYHGKDDN